MIRTASAWLIAIAALAGPAASGGGPDPDFLSQYAQTYRFRLGHPTSINPAPDGRTILFLRTGPRSFERVLYEYDVATGVERVLLTARQLLAGEEETVTADEQARRERKRLVASGIASFQLSEDGRRVLVPLSGMLFMLARAGGVVRRIEIGGGRAEVPRLSPDGNRIAFVGDGELHVVEIGSGPPRRLTHDAGGAISNGLAEFVAQEEMGRHDGFWWSPDSARIAYQQTDTAGVERLTIADARNPDHRPHEWPYPRPGRANAEVRLGIVSAEGGPTQWVEWDRARYPYLATVKWKKNAPLTILVQDRPQTEEVLLEVDAATGRTRALLAERDDAWLRIDQRMPDWRSDGSGFLWVTERRGHRELELRDRDGDLDRVIVPGPAGLRDVVHLDDERRAVYVIASQDPTQARLYRYKLDAGSVEPRLLSPKPGLHGARFSEGGDIFVHTHYGMTGDSVTVRRAGGEALGTLVSVAEAPSFGLDLSATVELTTVTDASFHAALVRPHDFEPARYPVIVHVYGGPGGQMVRRSSSAYLLDQWIADHGYVVVRIDGRGTPSRGRVWERAIKGDLIDLPLRDQADALQALGVAYGELDLSRVGIFGWSFGGYFSAMAVMRRPDVFHAGVAGAPVVDWRDYDTHYTERYMGLPQDNPSGYDAAGVLTWAADLSRPLLIIHGTADDNVYFMHTLKLTDALFRAGKPYELLPLAGLTHMVPDPEVTERLYERIMDFFETNVKSRSAAGGRRSP